MGHVRPDRPGPDEPRRHALLRLGLLGGGAARTLLGLLLALWAAAAPAQTFPAQTFPALFSITGVAADDVLNIRAAPSASAPVLGALPPFATGVEVLGLSPDGRWARVPLREGEGWVARRFLAGEGPGGPRAIPRPLLCLGTEPFWSLRVTGDGAVFETPDGRARPLRPLGEAAGVQSFALAFDGGGAVRDLFVARAACSDGMSGRPYGLTALVWDRGGGVLEGCCTLSAR